MINFIQYLLVSVLVFALGFIPGYLALRAFTSLRDDELIVSSFGVSFLFLFISSFTAFLLNINQKTFNIVSTLIFVAILIAFISISKKEFHIIGNDSRKILLLLFIFYLHIAFFESIIQSLFYYYTSGFCGNDWLGFYGTAQFYSSNGVQTYGYSPIGRTPLYYILGGFFLSIFGNSFWVYQIANSILSTTFILSVYLLSKKLINNKIAILTIFFIFFSPYFFKIITYPWSKPLTVYFVILSVYFYLKIRERKFEGQIPSIDTFLCGIFAGLAYLSHQLGLLYIIGIGIDYLLITRFKIAKRSMKYVMTSILTMVAVIIPWYLWALSKYGVYGVLSSNPPITETTPLEWIYTRLHDFATTFVPIELIYYVFRTIHEATLYFGKIFDSILSFYFHTIIGAFTFSLSIFAIYVARKQLIPATKEFCNEFKRDRDFGKLKNKIADFLSMQHSCMLLLIITGFVGGILVHPAIFCYNHGVAMACLTPLIPLLLIYLIKYAALSSKQIKNVIFIGVIIEFMLTTWMQIIVIFLNLKTLPICSTSSALIIQELISGKVFVGEYWIFSLIFVILIELSFLFLFYNLFVGLNYLTDD